MKICLICLFLQDQSILTDSIITVYTTEGSMVNLTFKIINSEIDVRFNERYIYYYTDHKKVITNKYDMVVRPNIVEIQKINVTTNDTGIYWLDDRGLSAALTLNISNMSCPSRVIEHVCAIEGSTSILTFTFEGHLYHSIIKDGAFLGKKSRRLNKYAIHVDLHIYNVTLKDKGYYRCYMYDFGRVKLQVAKLWFINQTDRNKIVGQEGTDLDIKCSSDTGQFIAALQLESNETIKAIGDNQSVSFSFKPDRTDHLSKYKCVDSKRSSIMIEITLFIRYSPAVKVHYTNETIECECDGVPAFYSVYRLDHISKNGELVRSVNLKNETFTIQKNPFPYQMNGRYECVVSNGIPDIKGKVLQTSSLNVQYEGSPVFAKENKYVKIGKVGHSIKLSFLIYSYPDVEEIFLEKLGGTYSRKRKITNFHILNSTLRYTGFENKVGIQGYEILIEIEILDIKDFRVYRITAVNRLGASDYHFEIIEKEDTAMTRFLIPSIVGVVLFSFVIIVYVCFRVKRTQVSAIRDHIVPDDPNYEEFWPISYWAVSNVRSSHSNDIQDQHLTHPGASGISKRTNVQSFVDNESNTSDETTSDFFDIRSLQRETTEVHRVSISSNDTHVSSIGVAGIASTSIQSTDNAVNCNQFEANNIKEISSSHISQSSIDFGSGPSNNVIDGSVGDEDENPYEFIW